MNLNGKQLVELQVITGEITEENIQPAGVDLNVVDIRKILGGGRIPKEGKTILPNYEPVILNDDSEKSGVRYWILGPGVYDVIFSQGCVIPPNQRLFLIQRSSAARNGSFVKSSMFDPGFQTQQIGSVLIVDVPITIEYGARLVQAYTEEINVPEELYNGQWQKDQQREIPTTSPEQRQEF